VQAKVMTAAVRRRQTEPLRVVSFSPYAPWSGVPHAGGVYVHQYLKQLRAVGAQVSTVVPGFAFNADVPESEAPDVVVPIPLTSRAVTSRAARYLHSLADGLSPGPFVLRALTRDRRVQALVRDADVIDLQYGAMLPLVPWLRSVAPQAVICVHEHDRVAQAAARGASSPSRKVRLRSHVTASRVARAERGLLDQTDVVFTLNPADATWLQNAGVRARVHAIGPYVEIPDAPAPAAGTTAIFVAAFDRPENEEAALWLLDEIWPGVMAAADTTPRLVLAGAHPSRELQERASDSVHITGYVDDLATTYREAALAVVPLRRGAGVKFKVAQALAWGLPVVTTPVGAEGLDTLSADSDIPIVVTDSSSFVRAVTRLLDDEEHRRHVGRKAFEWAQKTFDFERQCAQAFHILEPLVERRVSS
jgi:glycosyltransferase involved in cell wall biosynthesis